MPTTPAPGDKPGKNPQWGPYTVRALRRHLGYSQDRMARDMGTRQQTISEWETGLYRPRGTSRTLPGGRILDTRYRYGRGDRVKITSGRFQGCVGTVVSIVFQRSVDHPDEWAPGYQITLNDDTWAQVRWDQVRGYT